MSGTGEISQWAAALLTDFQYGFSSMLHRCPPIQLPFMIAWISGSAQTPAAACLLSIVFLTGTVFFSLLTNHTGHPYAPDVNMFAARHTAFFHVSAGILALLAVYQFSGLAKNPVSGIRRHFIKSAFACLYWSAYFVLLENITCAHCPFFFAQIMHPAGAEQTPFPILRIAFYKTGHAASPLLIALLLTLFLHTQKFRYFQPSARFIFSLPIALFGFFFFFIA